MDTSTALLIRPLRSDDEPFLWEALYHAIYLPPAEPATTISITDVMRPELARYVHGWMRQPGDLGFLAEQAGYRSEPCGCGAGAAADGVMGMWTRRLRSCLWLCVPAIAGVARARSYCVV